MRRGFELDRTRTRRLDPLGLKITLPDEPGLLPVMVSLKALRQGGTGPVKIGVHGLQKSGQGS